jgi:hypothetical protein
MHVHKGDNTVPGGSAGCFYHCLFFQASSRIRPSREIVLARYDAEIASIHLKGCT